jgi:polyphosphate kinase 2 (PPK2 family)
VQPAYNRPGVERAMGYRSKHAAQRFLQEIPHPEALLVEAGITLLKSFLTVGEEEQERRFRKRIPYERLPYEAPKFGERQKRPDDFRKDTIARNVVPVVS